MADVVRVGIIGAGSIARDRHIPLLQKVRDVSVTQLWSRTMDNANKTASDFGVPTVVENWEEIVDSPDVDAVVIATPPILHLPATLAALESGKHVLCQARMARNLSEALKMLEASKNTHLVTALYPAGFGLKGDRVMRRLIGDGFIGDIVDVRVTSVGPSPGGGGFMDDPSVVGINAMMLGILGEVCNRWMAPPVSVAAVTGEPLNVVPQSLAISAELPGGITASFHLSFRVTNSLGNTVEIFGTRGSLKYDMLVERPDGTIGGEEVWGMTESETEMYPIEIPAHEERDRTTDSEFIESIRSGVPVYPDFEEGVRYMQFSEAVAQSILDSRTIKMPPEPKMDCWGNLL